jgi:hypothetical protein
MVVHFEQERHHHVPYQARDKQEPAASRHRKEACGAVNVMETGQRGTAEVAKELDATRRGSLAGLQRSFSLKSFTEVRPHMNAISVGLQVV